MCKLHYVWISEISHELSPFIAYENDELCQFVIRIGSPELISFYCVCFVSFHFFLFFLFSLWVLLLAEILRKVCQFLK